MVKKGTFITNRLRERGKTAADVARVFEVKTPYIYRIIHGKNQSWHPKALRIRSYIARLLQTEPEELWFRKTKDKQSSS